MRVPRASIRRFSGAALVFLTVACGDPPRLDDVPPSSHPSAGTGDPGASRVDASGLIHTAEHIVDFLSGRGTLDPSALADSVRLMVPPEAGGSAISVGREALRHRQAWRIPSVFGSDDISILPPPAATERTVREGAHLRCMDSDLARAVPEYAGAPHVGVMLRPPDAISCLQAWILTLVFERTDDGPRVIAAVYDQWEW